MKLNFENMGIKVRTSEKGIYIKGSSHRIPNFKISGDVALFLGLLFGDGWMTDRKRALVKGDWKIGLVEDDKGVIDIFSELVKNVFNVKVALRFRKTYYEAYFSSRLIYEVLNRTFEFPDGYKFGKLKIPKMINESKELLTPFLRGLFSTDGKFTIYKNYPRIGLDSATKEFIEEIYIALENLGFNPRKYTWKRKEGGKLYGLYLNGKDQVKLFAQKINFVGDKRELLEKYVSSCFNASLGLKPAPS